MPPIRATDRVIFDIGCGVGQTLIAANPPDARLLIGADVDEGALALGCTLTDRVQFIRASAEAIPLASACVDLVISRVALPYTDIPSAAREMARLLKPGGRCWVTLHPLRFAIRDLAAAVRARRAKQIVYRCYVLANGLLLHFTGRVVRYPLRRTRLESVQTVAGVRRAFQRAGFIDVSVTKGTPFLLTARSFAGPSA
jgi:ubiquinone/menaquinone biosynthesis C-methylase UbiE